MGLFITLGLLKKHTGTIKVREFLGQHLRLLGAAIAVMAPLFALTEYLTWIGVELSPLARAGELGIVMLSAFIGYLIAGKAAGVQEISMIRHLRDSVVRPPKDAE